MRRVTIFKSILWTIIGLAMASGLTRMFFGLGSVTNQGDATPWGIWKGVNVVPGIALAAGGFVVTALIYVLRRNDLARYSKFAVLLAFLGYISAATALVVELGLPWMVWHPVIYWQHHSALFEISWCVILYLGVLFLEFVPVPLEETGWFASVRRFLIKYKLVLVILGVMISTLHQSSLGTLFLITPNKLHPLWYSSLLPIQFFISAIAIGPLMVMLAVLVVSALYKKPLEIDKLGKFGLFSMAVLAIYGLIRIIDIVVTGKTALIFDGSWQSLVFLLEIVLILVIPISLLAIKKTRLSKAGLWLASLSGVLGMVLNRADIAGIMLVRTGKLYIPTIYEVFISLGILSAAALVFLFCVERLKLWETKWEDPLERSDALPEFDRSSEVWLGSPRLAGRTIYSLIFIVSLAIGFAIISGDRIYSKGVKDVAADKARGSDILFIDGNRDTYGVNFNHAAHMKRRMAPDSCAICHHMNLPQDQNSLCSDCHHNMYTAYDAFRHDWHSDPSGGNIPCNQCHPADLPRSAAGVKPCADCHTNLIPEQATIEIKQYMAPSYTDAMHGTCVSCHQAEANKDETKANLPLCGTCHAAAGPAYLTEKADAFRDTTYNHIVLPLSQLENMERTR